MGTYDGFEGAQPQMLPFWIADSQGTAFQATFGRTKDLAQAQLEQATRARYPYGGRPDALPLAAADRLMLRTSFENDQQFADRLIAAPDTWKWGGTPTGIVQIFAPFGYDATTCGVFPNHYGILDGNKTWFSRCLILLAAKAWSVDGLWSDPGTYDDGGTWDSTALVSDLDYMRTSIRIVKSDQSYPVTIGVQLLGAAGDGFWDVPFDNYDVPGAFWDDNVADCIFWTVGHVWGEEAWLTGSGVEGTGQVWDQGGLGGDTWDSFVEPSAGWHLFP